MTSIPSDSKATNEDTSPLFTDLRNGKLKEAEILFLSYLIETERFNLEIGLHGPNEIGNIQAWEEKNGIDDILSKHDPEILMRFELRVLMDWALSNHLREGWLHLPDDIQAILSNAVEYSPTKEGSIRLQK